MQNSLKLTLISFVPRPKNCSSSSSSDNKVAATAAAAASAAGGSNKCHLMQHLLAPPFLPATVDTLNLFRFISFGIRCPFPLSPCSPASPFVLCTKRIPLSSVEWQLFCCNTSRRGGAGRGACSGYICCKWLNKLCKTKTSAEKNCC